MSPGVLVVSMLLVIKSTAAVLFSNLGGVIPSTAENRSLIFTLLKEKRRCLHTRIGFVSPVQSGKIETLLSLRERIPQRGAASGHSRDDNADE